MTAARWSIRPRTVRARRGAFTFIEILATMTFLAVILPSVMDGISLCMSTAEMARNKAQATALCHSKLMELATDSEGLQANSSGDFGQDYPGYRWTSQYSDWEDGTLRQLDLTVQWRQRGKDRDVMLSTLVAPQTTEVTAP